MSQIFSQSCSKVSGLKYMYNRPVNFPFIKSPFLNVNKKMPYLKSIKSMNLKM